jgi:hypothetical protein
LSVLPSLDPELEAAIDIPNRPMVGNEADDFALTDRPAQFGDDCIDALQGLLNISRNAKLLLGAPGMPRVDAPAICVGGGPSLGRHIEALKRLQHKCVIVCAQTSVKGLMANGIMPHLATPMERGIEMCKYMPEDCGTVAFAGAPLVNPGVCSAFKSHHYVGSLDALYEWTSLPGERRYYFGSSTGTTACSVASMMSRKVYLIGHDLAYEEGNSHWNASQAERWNPETSDIYPIEGHNGETLKTTHIYRRLEDQLRALSEAHGNIVNVNAHDRIFAKIRSAKAEPLPDPDTLADFTMPICGPVPERKALWKRNAVKLPYSARKIMRFFQNAKDISAEQTHIFGANQGVNGQAIGYMLTSVFAQISYECRMKTIRPHVALDWLKTATTNVLSTCMPVFEEIADHGHSC